MAAKPQLTRLSDLEQMTPQASREDFAQRVVTDYEALPPSYVERLQAAMDETMNRNEGVSEQSA